VGKRSTIPCCSKTLRRLSRTRLAFFSEMPRSCAYSVIIMGNTTGGPSFLSLLISQRSTSVSLILLVFLFDFGARLLPLRMTPAVLGPPPEDYTYLIIHLVTAFKNIWIMINRRL
jgi:hypothetical protein